MNSKDPLHGVTLEALLTELVAHHGWDGLARQVDVRCFKHDPSIKSSLSFLEKRGRIYLKQQKSGKTVIQGGLSKCHSGRSDFF